MTVVLNEAYDKTRNKVAGLFGWIKKDNKWIRYGVGGITKKDIVYLELSDFHPIPYGVPEETLDQWIKDLTGL